MSTLSLLHRLIKQALPELHRTRLKSLMATVEAGLKGVSVSLTDLGRALSGPAYIKHKIKRIDRLLGNPNLKAERQKLYGVMTQWLLQSLPLPLILIDCSPLTADQSQQLLRTALPTGGRTITLYEEIHPRKKLGNPRVQQQFLSRLQALLPTGVTPIIVADSGFRTPFVRAVEALNWHWLGRSVEAMAPSQILVCSCYPHSQMPLQGSLGSQQSVTRYLGRVLPRPQTS